MAIPMGPFVATGVFCTGAYKAYALKQPLYFRFSTIVAFGTLIGSLSTPPTTDLAQHCIRETVMMGFGAIVASLAAFAFESMRFAMSQETAPQDLAATVRKW